MRAELKPHFDLAIGNPPFSDRTVRSDRAYRALGLRLHDYFIAKAIDRLKRGGLAAFVTSSGTMDKVDASAREHIAAMADLVGAIRLPEGSFRAEAGSEVVVDILFFRKRLDGEPAGNDAWLDLAEVRAGTEDEGAIRINRYFAEHPEMVLGEHALRRGVYGPDETYLSGALRSKLAAARAAAELDPVFARNVAALERVQPADLRPSDITARLGAPWIPAVDIIAFVKETMDAMGAPFGRARRRPLSPSFTMSKICGIDEFSASESSSPAWRPPKSPSTTRPSSPAGRSMPGSCHGPIRIGPREALEDQKEVWKKHKPSKADPQVSWWSVAQALTKTRMYARDASFGEDLAQAYGILWQEDLFAPADEDSRYTTDVEAYLGAQHEWMASHLPKRGAIVEVNEWGQPKLPPKADRVYGKPGKSDHTAMYLDRDGKVQSVSYRLPAAAKKKAGTDEAASGMARSRRRRHALT